MTITLYDSVTLTVDAALSAATDVYGAWDAAEWDADTWGPDEVYTDISAYVRSVSTDRGFSREVSAWAAGDATIIVDDRDARFCPDNLDGPYVTAGITGIRPWRPLRVRATYAGTTYPLYQGYAKDFIESYPIAKVNDGDAIVTIPCVDEWAALSGYSGFAVDPEVGDGETYGARIHRLLDVAGHAGPRAIDTGSNTMQSTDLSSEVTSELSLTADSEGGAVWIDDDGTVVGSRQYALVEESRSINSQATFGDGTGELPIANITLGNAGDLIINIATYKCVDGDEQTFSDATSRALYRDKRDSKTNLICETDEQAMRLAAWKVARYKAPERRVESITIKPRRDPTNLFPAILGLKVRDLVTVKRRPPGGTTITQYCHVAGIAHHITKTTWETTIKLWSATPYLAFSQSLWDTGLWGDGPSDPDGALWFY